MKLIALILTAALTALANAGEMRTIHSQPSWIIGTQQMEVAVTETGAMMAPVTFYRDTDHPVQPYHISPWQDEGLKLDVPVLVALRGDWFCVPFGGNNSLVVGRRGVEDGFGLGENGTGEVDASFQQSHNFFGFRGRAVETGGFGLLLHDGG